MKDKLEFNEENQINLVVEKDGLKREIFYQGKPIQELIKYKDMWIGITDLNFAKWESKAPKNQMETPYTEVGRELYFKRMRRKGSRARTDEVNSSKHALFLRMSKHPLYNFEYFMNRPYCYSRDKGKCKVCGGYVEPNEVRIHHVQPKLPTHLVSKTANLITVHEFCHSLIHDEKSDISMLSVKTQKKITRYRNKLID